PWMAPTRCCFDQTAVWHSDAARGPSTPSFDHLVGGDQQLVWNRDAPPAAGVPSDGASERHQGARLTGRRSTRTARPRPSCATRLGYSRHRAHARDEMNSTTSTP